MDQLQDFYKWTNVLYYLTTVKGLTNERIAGEIKDLKLNQIEHWTNSSYRESESWKRVLLASIIETFSLEETEIANVSLTNIRNAIEMTGQWGFALKMYLIISYNPKNADIYQPVIEFIDKLLKSASPSTVAQALLFTLNGNNQLWSDLNSNEMAAFIQVIGVLYETLEPIFDWKLGTIDLALSTRPELLRQIGDKQFEINKEDIKSCLQQNRCERVHAILQSLKKDGYKISEISNHPPHILNAEDQMNPSAFIPFCQFDNKAIGKKIDQFSEKVCTGFKPTILHNQLCYSLDVNDISYFGERPAIHEENSLVLFLDYNLETSAHADENIGTENITSSLFNIRKDTTGYYWKDATSKTHAKIHLNNIEEFVHFGGGKYEMSAVKVISTTPEFNKFEEAVKGCQSRCSVEDCIKQNLLKLTTGNCSCIPFHLMTVDALHKVSVSGLFDI